MAAAAAVTIVDESSVGGMGPQDQDPESEITQSIPTEKLLDESPNSKSPKSALSPYTTRFFDSLSSPDTTFGENTSKNSSVVFCRICHEGESGGERLISPCRCCGSVGLVHRTCIEKWLTVVNIDSCELCKQKYSVMRHPRPFSSWLCEPVIGDDQRNLVGDGICFLLLTPLSVISAYLCASGAAFYFKEKKSEAIGLICLSSMLVFIYIAWLVLTIRYHCQVWFKWRINNQDVRLLNVSGEKSATVSTRQRHPRMSPSTGVENVEVHNLDLNEAAVTDVTLAEHLVRPYSISSPSTNSLDHPDLTANQAVLVNSWISERKEYIGERSPRTGQSPCTPTQPLSPCVISLDPQSLSHSKIVRTTDDSEIYAQISSPCSRIGSALRSIHFPLDYQLSIHDRAVSVPYIPDLKEHFIALRSKQDEDIKTVKSRGTFSPNRKPRTVTEVSEPSDSECAVPQYTDL